MVNRRSQRGMSMFGLALILGVVFVFGKLALGILPSLYDNYAIGKIIGTMFREVPVDAKGLNDVKADIDRRFDVNQIKRRAKDFQISKDGNKITVVVEYEDRVPFFANVDLVMHYNKTYTSTNPEGVASE